MRYAKYLVYELACHQLEWFGHQDTLSRFVVAEMQSVNLEPSSRGYQMRKIKIHRRISQSASDIYSFLAFHGTEINELGQIIDDLAFSAIGQYLFVNNEFLIRQTIQEILETSQTLNLNRLVICGYSLGGAIAQHVACVYPELVERVVTFQAPGTSNYYLQLSNNALSSRDNLHFRVDVDIIHHAGDRLVPGARGSRSIIYLKHPTPSSTRFANIRIESLLNYAIDAHLSLPLTTAYETGLGDSALSPDQSEMPSAFRQLIEFGRTYMGARIREAGSETSNEKTYIDLWEEIRHQIRRSPNGFTSEARSEIKRRIGNLFVDSPSLSERMLEQLTLLYPIHFPSDSSQSRQNTSRESRGSYPLGSWRNGARTRLQTRNLRIPTGRSVHTAIQIILFQPIPIYSLIIPSTDTSSVPIGGIAWQLEDNNREIRIYSWNTSPMYRTDNNGHAEERFISWMIQNTQILPYIQQIIIRNFSYSPCSICSGQLSGLLEQIKRRQSPDIQKPIKADIFWMRHYDSQNGTTTSWQSIEYLSNAGWNLHAPLENFPPIDLDTTGLRGRLRSEEQYRRSVTNPRIFPRRVESRSANERTLPLTDGGVPGGIE